MARVFLYKGRSIEDLQKLSIAEFSKLVKARPRRAIKRMAPDYKDLIKKVEKIKASGAAKAVRTHTREAVIIPQWVGMRFAVFNGKEYKEFNVVPEMLGHRLGEYSFTTKAVVHSAPGIRATRGSKFLAVK